MTVVQEHVTTCVNLCCKLPRYSYNQQLGGLRVGVAGAIGGHFHNQPASELLWHVNHASSNFSLAITQYIQIEVPASLACSTLPEEAIPAQGHQGEFKLPY